MTTLFSNLTLYGTKTNIYFEHWRSSSIWKDWRRNIFAEILILNLADAVVNAEKNKKNKTQQKGVKSQTKIISLLLFQPLPDWWNHCHNCSFEFFFFFFKPAASAHASGPAGSISSISANHLPLQKTWLFMDHYVPSFGLISVLHLHH